MRPALLALLLCLSTLTPRTTTAQAADGGVGLLRLTTTGEYAVPVAVWYPSAAPSTAFTAGPYEIHAAPNAPPEAGPHPVVLLSHGSGGSELGHADLAEALARRGYVVAAPRHLGDSYDRPDGRGTDRQLIGRPWQAVAALDAVLSDGRLSSIVDATRIGMAGFSAGGYTTLVMAGAVPDFRLNVAYCRAHADDRELCDENRSIATFVTRPGWALPIDHRVRAAVAMAPLGVLFDANGLKDVTVPLRIYEADDDRVLRNRWNTDHVLAELPRPAEAGVLHGGHYVFLAPCSEALRALAPAICVDAPDVDRSAEHARLNREIVDFFDRALR